MLRILHLKHVHCFDHSQINMKLSRANLVDSNLKVSTIFMPDYLLLDILLSGITFIMDYSKSHCFR